MYILCIIIPPPPPSSSAFAFSSSSSFLFFFGFQLPVAVYCFNFLYIWNVAKYFGACNDFKTALDACFRLEKEEKRKLNLQKAREFDKEFDREEQLKLARTTERSERR